MRKVMIWLLLICLLIPVSGLVGLAETETTWEDWGIPLIKINVKNLETWKQKDDERKATLEYQSAELNFTQEIKIKYQGSSAMFYPKKNFTIKLAEKVDVGMGWGKEKKYCLKANYIDPTGAVNIAANRLAASINEKYGKMTDSPNFGQVDGFPVMVELNGENWGLYTFNIPKDDWTFGMDNDKKSPHIVAQCDNSHYKFTDKPKSGYWTIEVGDEKVHVSMNKVNKLLKFVRNSTVKSFKAEAAKWLDIDSCLNYLSFVLATNGFDNCTKNLLLGSYDGEYWFPILYDLDTLWGYNWDGNSMIKAGHTDLEFMSQSRLWERIIACYPNELKTRYFELREDILSYDNMVAEIEAFRASVPEKCYEADEQRWGLGEHRIRTYEGTYEQMKAHLDYMDAEMDKLGE